MIQKKPSRRAIPYNSFERFFAVSYSFATYALLVSLLLQPVSRVSASEEVVTQEPINTEQLFTETVLPTDATVPDGSIDEPVASAEVAEVAPVIGDSNQIQTTPSSTPEMTTGVDGVTESISLDSSVSTTSSTTSEHNSFTTQSSATSTVETDTATSTLSPDTTATTSETDITTNQQSTPETSVPEELPVDDDVNTPLTYTTGSDEIVTFNNSACIPVGDGTFYCRESAAADNTRADGVYAFPDSDGDLEIYVQRQGELTQLTQNTLDDASPHYDPVSNTIVWHRLIDDRFQIISYDVRSATEQQLTEGSSNNMEPQRHGNFTVWQSWIENNWEIVLHNGQSTQRLTTTPTPDINPHIKNGLVVWNTIGVDGTLRAELYNLTTGEYVTINDAENGTITNPRMVIMFDSQLRNGDVVTKGYDMITGEIVPLAATPQPDAPVIPSPDSTGEHRALMITTTKPTNDDGGADIDDENESEPDLEIDPEFDVIVGVNTEFDNATTSTSTDVSDFDVDLRPASTTDELAEFTLVVPSLETATATEELTVSLQE